MKEKLNLISEKVDGIVALVKQLRSENDDLTRGNRALKTQINHLLKESKEAGLDNVDKRDSVKTKLNLVLNRLEELGSLAG